MPTGVRPDFESRIRQKNLALCGRRELGAQLDEDAHGAPPRLVEFTKP